MTTYIQANTMGRLHDATEPSFSPLNRGFLYGDAIYEVWRTYDRVLFAMDEHWARLGRSAAALHMEIGLSQPELLEEIRRAAHAFRSRTGHEGELYVRLQVTRGGGPIGLDVALAGRPEWVILVQALRPGAPASGRQGLHLSVARDLCRNSPQALNPAWKTGNYLNNLLCLREARARGADEVVILSASGAVTEAAVCNIAFVRDGEIVTPPLRTGMLEGITRGLMIERVAASAGIRVREEDVSPVDFPSFSECFLTSSTRDIAAVERIDDVAFRVGEETVTHRLKSAFQEYVRAYARQRADLRV